MSGSSAAAQPKQVRDVVVPEAITVQELANRMAEKGSDLVKALFKMGMPVTLNRDRSIRILPNCWSTNSATTSPAFLTAMSISTMTRMSMHPKR